MFRRCCLQSPKMHEESSPEYSSGTYKFHIISNNLVYQSIRLVVAESMILKIQPSRASSVSIQCRRSHVVVIFPPGFRANHQFHSSGDSISHIPLKETSISVIAYSAAPSVMAIWAGQRQYRFYGGFQLSNKWTQ